MNYRRPPSLRGVATAKRPPILLVEGEGFEPSKAEPTDLQSVPFDRSGTPPAKQRILRVFIKKVKQLSIQVVSQFEFLPSENRKPAEAGFL